MIFYLIFVLFIVFSKGFDFSEQKKSVQKISFNPGKIYDLEEHSSNQNIQALKKLELLKNNDLDSILNIYFEEIDKNLDQFLKYNPTSFVIYYPSLMHCYSTYYNKERPSKDIPKHQEVITFFQELPSDLKILYKNESYSLYKSRDESLGLNNKLVELNLAPNDCFPIYQITGVNTPIYETLLIFESQNINFKQIIQSKFKNAKNIYFENYFVLIVI